MRPETVIKAPYIEGFSGSRVNVAGLPYFFNIKKFGDLLFSWSVNGEKIEAAEKPEELSVNINPDAQAGSALSISLLIKNQEQSESASDSITLKLLK